MNQRVQLGLLILAFLLIVLLCPVYYEIPPGIIKRFTATSLVTGDGEPVSHEVPRGLLLRKNGPKENGTDIKELPQPIIDRIKTMIFFLGHPRSGHSIVASLMDSHPHMVVSHEVDLFGKLSKGTIAPTKQEICNTVWKNSVKSITGHGKRANTTVSKGYTLFVDGLYQGTYVQYIDVIGDKKAGITTKLLQKQPDIWARVFTTLKSLVGTIKVIHVIRNPYDNVATMAFFNYNSQHKKSEFAKLKQSNQTYVIDSDVIDEQIKIYFLYHQAITNAKNKYNYDLIEIHGKDLISDPRGTLLKMCNDLGVTCSDNYLEVCSNKVFKTESRTRHKIKWTDEQLKMIQNNINKFSNLKDYNFDSM